MPDMLTQLELDRCPHCEVDRPTLSRFHSFATHTYTGENKRVWGVHVCSRCGGAMLACGLAESHPIAALYPSTNGIDKSIPGQARGYLKEAISTQQAPNASIMVCASAVDAMLKAKGYTEGWLFDRINKAVEDGLLTEAMGKWAHQIRLDANDPRHADQKAAAPTTEDAARCIEFAKALAEFVFVLPSRVTRGLTAAIAAAPAEQQNEGDEK